MLKFAIVVSPPSFVFLWDTDQKYKYKKPKPKNTKYIFIVHLTVLSNSGINIRTHNSAWMVEAM